MIWFDVIAVAACQLVIASRYVSILGVACRVRDTKYVIIGSGYLFDHAIFDVTGIAVRGTGICGSRKLVLFDAMLACV